MCKKMCAVAVFLMFFVSGAMAQSEHSATSGARRLFVGGEFSTFNPDWGCVSASPFSCGSGHLLGVGALVDANHVWRRLGVEGEALWLHWSGPGHGLVESSYLIGPRYQLFQKQSFALYGKGLVGIGRITRSYNLGQGSYFDLAPGATVEYRITGNVVIRADYEYQVWPGFQGLPGQSANGLTPNGFSFGFGYRL